MLNDLLRVLVVVGSGTVAGVFIAVTLSVMPALAVLPTGTYVRVHILLGKGYHPIMPLVVLLVLAGDIVLAVTTPHLPLLTVAIVAQLGVQGVSHLGNERLNKRVRAVEGATIAADWNDPRETWRRWHLLRTVLAIVVFAINATIAVLPH